jgi:hypothetical protein
MINETMVASLSNSSLQEKIALVMTDYVFQLIQDHNVLLVLLAFVGIFTLIRASVNTGAEAITIIVKLFIITPVIITTAILSAKDNPHSKSEAMEILHHIRTTPRMWVVLIGWLVILACFGIYAYMKIKFVIQVT